jgi:hypothetical protein
MIDNILDFILRVLLFMLAFTLFGWLFTLGGSSENIEILRAIGNATGTLMFIIVDQCNR